MTVKVREDSAPHAVAVEGARAFVVDKVREDKTSAVGLVNVGELDESRFRGHHSHIPASFAFARAWSSERISSSHAGQQVPNSSSSFALSDATVP